MKKYFAQLRPPERRLAVGVLVILIIVLNWVFIWPHHSDWGNLKTRQQNARASLQLFQTTITQSANYAALVKKFASQGDIVAPEDQAVNFLRTIQTQSDQSHVGIVRMYSQPTRTNDVFFVEQVQNINVVATDAQLVDFLYKLGNDAAMVRVIGLEMQPDPSKLRLTAQIRLVASYQRNPKPAPAANLKPATAKPK